MKNKNLLLIILALVLIISISFAYGYYITHRSCSLCTPSYDHPNYTYLYGLEWHRSLDKGFQIAQQENKPIAVYFWAIWCQNCSKFQSYTFANPQVKKILNEDYVLVAMDLDIDIKVAHKYNVSYPPYVLLLDKNDNVLERVAGEVDANTFLPIVTQARDLIRDK